MNERTGAEALTPKIYSRRLVAEALLRGAPASRARLARETGLSKQTISLAIADLEAEGWVRPMGTPRAPPGAAPSATISPPRRRWLSASISAARKSRSRSPISSAERLRRARTPPTGAAACTCSGRSTRWRGRRRRGAHSILPARGASWIGMPGVVDPQTGRVSLVPNIRGLSDLSVPAALGDLFAAPVTVENDVNLAMLGEAWQGCARGAANAAFLALGTGAGLGMIVNGQLARGARGAAGEIAYLPIGDDLDSDDARASARSSSRSAAQASCAAIARRRAKVSDVRDVFDRLEAGEGAATEVIDATARAVALALTSVAALLDPELIVLGGSIGVRPELGGARARRAARVSMRARRHPRQRARRPRRPRRRRLAGGAAGAEFAVRRLGPARRLSPPDSAFCAGRRMRLDAGASPRCARRSTRARRSICSSAPSLRRASPAPSAVSPNGWGGN